MEQSKLFSATTSPYRENKTGVFIMNFKEESHELPIAISLGVMALINLTGNSLVCVVILRNKNMRTPMNYLLLNLAIADILIGILSVPFDVLGSLYIHPKGKDGDIFCKIISGDNIFYICGQVSALTLAAIAYERYQAVVFPLTARQKVSRKKVLIFVTVIWTFAIAGNVPWFHWLYFDEEESICMTKPGVSYIAFVLSIVYGCCAFGVPLVVMLVLYGRIIRELMKKQDQIVNREQLAAHRLKKKIIIMLITVTVIFAACWGTDTVLSNWNFNNPDFEYLIVLVSPVLVSFNSSINGIIYALFSQQFQKGIKDIFKCTRQPLRAVPRTAEPLSAPWSSMQAEDTKL